MTNARRLRARPRAAYLIGREEPLKLLLAARDPLLNARMLAYYGYLGRARARQISDIEQHVQRVDQLDGQLAQQQTELANLKAAQQAELSNWNTRAPSGRKCSQASSPGHARANRAWRA